MLYDTKAEPKKERRPKTTLQNLWGDKAKGLSSHCNCNMQEIEKSWSCASDCEMPLSWTCTTCTLIHVGQSKQRFLSCELCGTARSMIRSDSASQAKTTNDGISSRLTNDTQNSSAPTPKSTLVLGSASSLSPRLFPSTSSSKSILKQQLEEKQQYQEKEQQKQSQYQHEKLTGQSLSCCGGKSWGSLRAPSKKDIQGPRKRRKAFDLPAPAMDYLVVLDFEWTADNTRKMQPIAEITQFPSLVMKVIKNQTKIKKVTSNISDDTISNSVNTKYAGGINTVETTLYLDSPTFKRTSDSHATISFPENEGAFPPSKEVAQSETNTRNVTPYQLPSPMTMTSFLPSLPPSLPTPSFSSKDDAHAISAFDTFVKPTLNPTLTKFSIELTDITQSQVDASPTLDIALKYYMEWLRSINLTDNEGNRIGHWSFVTWGDGDIMSTLRTELQYKWGKRLPPCFDRWINLKEDSIYKRHYGREPKGGLRKCVESVGATWEGRAHNGFVDSINTAKIVRHMIQTGFRFTRHTRGLDKNGIPFGQKSNEEKQMSK